MYEKQADANECLDPDLLIKDHVQDNKRLLRRENNPNAEGIIMNKFLFPIQGNISPTFLTSERNDVEEYASMEHKIKAFSTEIKDGGLMDSQEGTLISVLLINCFGWDFMFPDSTLLTSSLFPGGSPPAHLQ